MKDILSQLDANFARREVGIVEFAESHEFCGKKLYPRQKLLLKMIFLEELTDEEEAVLDYWERGGSDGNEVTISPYMRERMKHLRDTGYSHFREITLVGGRRSSKGFITGLCLAKKVHELVQIPDPATHYGIDREKEIVFACVAAAQQQAKDMQYADFAGTVNSCKALEPYIRKMQELEFSVETEKDRRNRDSWKRQGRTVQKDTSKIRGRALPANSRTIRGSAMMACVFDEFGFFLQGESDQADSQVYAAAIPSLSQFGMAAMIFCNSSPYAKVGMLYERYEAAMATDNGKPNDPRLFTLRFPSWALYDGWWQSPLYTGPKHCQVQCPDWDPDEKKEDDSYLYTPHDREGILIERSQEHDDPIKFKVEKRSNFAEVVDSFLNPAAVDRMFRGIPMPDGSYQELKTNRSDSTYEKEYRAHLDPSSTTAGFGFALGHVEQITMDGRTEPHVVFDIIKRWNPKDFKDEVIDWDVVIEEVLHYADIFRPREISMDQHNSKYPIQTMQRQLAARGINEVRVYEKTANLNNNWNRAEVFRTALYRNLIHAPHDTPDAKYAAEEMKYLQEIRTARVPRVEKQTVGPVQTKDMADAAFEVVESLIGNIIANDVRSDLAGAMRLGAQGGYQIGGNDRFQMRPLQSPDGRTFYGTRVGEQSFRGARRGAGKAPPTRRPIGGKPGSRKLPGW